MSKLFKSKSIAEQKFVECPVCMDDVPFSKTLELSCQHRYCLECLTREWEYNIMNSQISDTILKCPTENCKMPITYFELKSYLKPEVFQKYEEFTIKTFQLSDSQNEMTVVCPNADCQIKYVVFKGASYFTCSQCQVKFCCDCYGSFPQHEGLTCLELKEGSLSKEERQFREEIRSKGWMSCPHCKMIIEKIEFCNFIRCRSPICQKKNSFCYLCGQALTEESHFEHYKDKNPYGNVCVGQNKSEEELKKKNSGGKEKDRFVQCPKCKSINEKEVALLENFTDKYCFCKSGKCQGKIYCLHCGEEIEDKNAMEHYEKKCNKIMKFCRIF